MKYLVLCMMMLGFGFASEAQEKSKLKSFPDPEQKVEIVEASCGQCNFGLKGKGCTLAVRIKGKAYFVEGTNIDDHGDSHDDDGFCNAVRKASVQGKVVNDKFVVQYFKLEPLKKKG